MKYFGIIVLIVVIGFAFTFRGDDGGEKQGGHTYMTEGREIYRSPKNSSTKEVVVLPNTLPEDSFYSFVAGYKDLLVVTYSNNDVVTIYNAPDARALTVMYTDNLGNDLCPLCASVSDVILEGNILYYAYETTDPGSPVFYKKVDLDFIPLHADVLEASAWPKK